MKLYLSPTSPYARLVSVVLAEKGLSDQVERVFVDPWASPAELTTVNPLSRVPVLITKSGSALTETQVIIQYFDHIAPNPALIPLDSPERTLHKVGFGHGLIEQAVAIVSTRKFRSGMDADPLTGRHFDSIRRCLPILQNELQDYVPKPDLGDLTIAVALGYLDFRLGELAWREHHPALARWLQPLEERASMVRTRPPG